MQSESSSPPTALAVAADVAEELARYPLLADLDEAERRALAATIEVRHVEAGHEIFVEGESSHELYLIRSGTVSVSSRDGGAGLEHVVMVLAEGDALGDLAFLDGAPHPSTARAGHRAELLVLRRDRVQALERGDAIVDRLARRIAVAGAEQSKRTTRQLVDVLRSQLEAMQLQHEFGQFFIYTMSCYAIGTMINVLLHGQLRGVDVYARTFSWSYLMVLLVPSLVIVRLQRMPLRRLGVTRRNWRRSAFEGAIASVVCIGLFALASAIGRAAGWSSPSHLGWAAAPWIPSYMAHAAIQEFLARGIVQTSFQRFFGDDNGWTPVVLASLLFSLFHVHFGLAAVLITFASSLVFGRFYLRHQNLIGVALLHGVAGSCAFLFGLI